MNVALSPVKNNSEFQGHKMLTCARSCLRRKSIVECCPDVEENCGKDKGRRGGVKDCFDFFLKKIF